MKEPGVDIHGKMIPLRLKSYKEIVHTAQPLKGDYVDVLYSKTLKGHGKSIDMFYSSLFSHSHQEDGSPDI